MQDRDENTNTLFEASVPQKNLRRLAAGLQCMSKIGIEVSFEIMRPRVLLRVLDDAKTAFFTNCYEMDFFEQYQVHTSADETLKFKVLLKPLTSILRSLRTVERLQITFFESPMACSLSLRLFCARGIVKTHSFQVGQRQVEIYQVLFNRQAQGPNRFVIKPKVLCDILDQIHGADQIVFTLSRQRAVVASHHHSIDEEGISVKSEIDVPISELEQLVLRHMEKESVSMIMCLTEIKSFLHYCMASGVQANHVSVFFSGNGAPMLFSTQGVYHAELILATVAEEVVQQEEEEENCMLADGLSLGGRGTGNAIQASNIVRTPHRKRRKTTPAPEEAVVDRTMVVRDEDGGGALDKTMFVGDVDGDGALDKTMVVGVGSSTPALDRTMLIEHDDNILEKTMRVGDNDENDDADESGPFIPASQEMASDAGSSSSSEDLW